MHQHKDPVAEAFDVIHETMRALRRENCELRMQLNQARAQLSLYATPPVTRLAKAAMQPQAAGVDVTGQIEVRP